jgi:TP901-1 family phage major tail protein
VAINGVDILLFVNVGPPLSPSWQAATGQRGATFDETTDEIDASSKDSRSKRVLAGRYGSTISMDGLYVPDELTYQALVAANRNGTFILVVRQEEGVDVEQATALVTSISMDAPDNDVSTCSISLTIDGEWTPIGT